MSDKRRIVMATLMLTIIIGQAGALTLIDYLMPVVLGPIGIVGYWLGLQKAEEYQQLIADYEAQLTSNTLQNDINTRLYLQEIYVRDNNIISLGQDLLQYSRNYAWALAKYEALKVIDYELTQNGSDFITAKTLAKQKAHEAVYNYYVNLTKNIIVLANESAELVNHSINYYLTNIKVRDVEMGVTGSQTDGSCTIWYYNIKYNATNDKFTVTYDSSCSGIYGQTATNSWKTGTDSINALGTTFNYVVPLGQVKNTNPNDGAPYAWVKIDWLNMSNERVYDRSQYVNIISQIDSEYNMINANIDAYIDGLAQDYVSNWNITDLIDPYIVAGLLNHDFNATGYMGYAAAELALLGLNTTGINKTITIIVYDGNNATTLEGWLFTDWVGTLVPGQNYTADPSYKWFFVGDNGLYDITGYNFTFVKATDWKGNPLQNVTLVRYVSHTGDVTKMYEELHKILQLYKEYIDNLQAMAAGGGSSGSGFNLSEWWNSLDQTAKIGIIAIGGIGVYALLRRD